MSSTPDSPNESLKGQFLVAGKQLRDPNFFRSVVLMVEHSDSGSMGLVVNRPSNVSVARALSGHYELPENDELVYVGGPVEPSALFVLHSAGEFEEHHSDVVPGIFVGSSPEVFERVIARVVDDTEELLFRIFAGCAGWAPGQLEDELSGGDWHLLPAEACEILPQDPYALWDELVGRIQATNRTVPPSPGNPEWN
jgi:putative transcriptional regulator